MTYLSINQVRKRLGRSLKFVKELIDSGRLKYITVGKRINIREDWLNDVKPDEPLNQKFQPEVINEDLTEFYRKSRKKWLKN